MGGTENKQNELNEFAIKFWAYLSVHRTEQGASSCLYFRKSVLRTRSLLKLQQRPRHTNTTLQGQSKSSEEGEIEEMSEDGKLAGRRLRERLWGFSQWGSVAQGIERIEMVLMWEPHQIAFL